MKTNLKKLICLGVLALLITVSYGQQKEKPSKVLNQNEAAAIQKVLMGSHTAFDNRDLKTFANYFVKTADLYYQVSTEDNKLFVAQGWEAMTHMVGGYMKEHPQANQGKHSLSNLKIHVNGNTAWVHYNGGEPIMSQDFLVLEKQAGQWKIAALTSQHYKEGEQVVVK